MKKNEIIQLQITDIGVNGEGVGRFEGCTFFVKDAMIGDTVNAVITKMKKGYGYAKMTELLSASPLRIQPPCPNAKRCGGCQIMEMSYDEQLKFKERKVRNNLKKIGGLEDFEFLPIIGMQPEEFSPGEKEASQVPVRYRNKMQFPFGRDRNGRIAAGFYAGRTHYIIDTDDCRIAPKVCGKILCCVKEFIRAHDLSVYNEETGQGLIRHLILRTGFRTGEIMVCLVLNGESLNEGNHSPRMDYEAEFTKRLLDLDLSSEGENPDFYQICSICINVNREDTNVILGKRVRCLSGRPFIFDEIQNRETGSLLKFKISPLSFYQVNPVQMEKLYAKALEFADLKGNETVWDLYCGTGTISLFLARKVKQVKGVEIVPDAIRDAKENARLNGIQNAEFFCGKAEEVFPMHLESRRLAEEDARSEETVVVLDPPRKGCERVLLETLLQTLPERIVYVSCDSATLARDLMILTEGGNYRVEKVQPTDMFPNSVHVETVCLLSNRKPDTKVRIDVDLEDYYRIKDSKKNQD